MSLRVDDERRLTDGAMGTRRGVGNYGAFVSPSPESGWMLYCIVDDGTNETDEPSWRGWEHVSVSARRGQQTRTPTWREMAFVKAEHWDAEDVVVQYHPRRSEYVNVHPHVLHLWRHRTLVFPTPPAILVGPVDDDERAMLRRALRV